MTENTLLVTKRDGHTEALDINKIHRVLEWAAEDLDVSVSEVELKAKIQFYDGVKTEDIHAMLIKSAADLIEKYNPDYQYMAARLLAVHLRKKAYGGFTPPTLLEHVKRKVEEGIYDPYIFEHYTEEEINELGNYIDHNRDFYFINEEGKKRNSFAYAGMKQLEGKYLIQNRVTGQLHETPQFLYMLVGTYIFAKVYTGEKRMQLVKQFYDMASTFKISLPTPIMGGVRTKTRQFASCFLVETDDSLDSINATSSAIVKYVSQRAGVGINAGRIRALGSPIRGGEAEHTGVIPFFKLFEAAVKSCSQGGIRGGAATLYYPMWHLEVESLLVLKNNRGVEDNRVRKLDYAVQINKTLLTRLIKNQHITLFSPNEVPGLYEAFFSDQEEFERLYTQYEADASIRKKQIPAIELFSSMMQERASTGRIYIHFVDHSNTHSPFNPKKAPIHMSNLCVEVALPTVPLNNVNDPDGELALCVLAAVNVGETSIEEMPAVTDILVRFLDALLDYQDYTVPAAAHSTLTRRPLGIGIINYAYWLTKQGIRMSDDEAAPVTHTLMEHLQYSAMKASVELAKEKGRCPGFDDLVLKECILPIDTYKRDIDKFAPPVYECDWESLREEIKEYGIRNSTLTAMMPSESSSQVSNATNGIEPPRSLVTVKASKDGILKQVVPEILRLGLEYETLWELKDMEHYFRLMAVIQKFTCQSISTNTSYDPKRYPGEKVPMTVLLKDLTTAYKYGLKTLYYHHTRDGADDRQGDIEDDGCAGGACKI